MKTFKTVKALGFALGALLLGIGIKKAWDYYNDVEQVDKKTKEKLDDLGISQEELEKVDPYDPNEFVKTLFIGVKTCKRIDEEILSVEFDTFWKNSIHVLTTTTMGKRNIIKKFVMYFGIPNFTDRNKNLPGFTVFKRTFDAAIDQLQEHVVKNCNVWAKKELVGIVSYYVKDEDTNEFILKVSELDSDVYENFKDGDKPGLLNFYKTYKEFENKDDNFSINWINETDKFILECEGYEDAEIYNISLAYKVSYFIASINNPGITWDQAFDMIEYLTKYLEISHDSYLKNNSDDPDPMCYNHVVFHCLNEDDEPDLYRFYEVNKSNKIKEMAFRFPE